MQRHVNALTEETWKADMQILSYLNATQDFGITYVRGSGLDLAVYVDASYADEDTERRSMSGIAVTLGGTAVSHTSKSQRVLCRLRKPSISQPGRVSRRLYSCVRCYRL